MDVDLDLIGSGPHVFCIYHKIPPPAYSGRAAAEYGILIIHARVCTDTVCTDTAVPGGTAMYTTGPFFLETGGTI